MSFIIPYPVTTSPIPPPPEPPEISIPIRYENTKHQLHEPPPHVPNSGWHLGSAQNRGVEPLFVSSVSIPNVRLTQRNWGRYRTEHTKSHNYCSNPQTYSQRMCDLLRRHRSHQTTRSLRSVPAAKIPQLASQCRISRNRPGTWDRRRRGALSHCFCNQSLVLVPLSWSTITRPGQK